MRVFFVFRGPHHHGLPHSEVWQQHVILHDVAGHLPEGPQVPRSTVHQDLALHARLPVSQQKAKLFCGHFLSTELNEKYHLRQIRKSSLGICAITITHLTCNLPEYSSEWISRLQKAPWCRSALCCWTFPTDTWGGLCNLTKRKKKMLFIVLYLVWNCFYQSFSDVLPHKCFYVTYRKNLNKELSINMLYLLF